MKIEDELAGRTFYSERFKQSMINRMAHRLAQRQIAVFRDQLQIQLDQAEMRSRDQALLSGWMLELGNSVQRRADACDR